MALLPSSLISLCRTTWSGPTIALIPLPWFNRVTHGTADPYSKRNDRSNRMSTDPSRPSTMRTMEFFSTAMKSISATDPEGVSNNVSRIMVPGQ